MMNGYTNTEEYGFDTAGKIRKTRGLTVSRLIILAVLGLIFISAQTYGTALTLIILAMALPIGFVYPETLFPIFFIVSLSGDYFGAFQGIGFPRIFGVILLLGAVRKIMVNGRIQLNYFGYYIVIAVATFISYLNAYVNSFTNLMTILMDITVFFSLTNLNLEKEELEKLFKNIFFAVVITTIFFASLFIFDPYVYIRAGARGLTVAANVNPNTFSQMMAQLGAFSLGYAYLGNQKRLMKYLAYFLGFLSLYCVAMTGSRAGTFAIMLGTFSAIVIFSFKNSINMRNVFRYILIAAIGIVIFYFILKSDPMLAERMNLDSLIESGGSGRWQYIQTELMYIIPEHLWFGVGIGTSNEVAAMSPYFINLPLSSTNFIVSMLAQVGLVGFVFYILFFRKVIMDTVKYLEYDKILFIPFILIMTALFNGLGEVVFYERYFWNALSLAVLCMITFRSAVSKGSDYGESIYESL